MAIQKPVNSYIKIISSKNGNPIPIIKGSQLHSIYNPLKEAELFTKENSEKLKISNNIIILGLGFAYHVEAISKYMKKLYKKNYLITVVEPNKNIYEKCINYKLISRITNTKYIIKDDIEKIYSDSVFINVITNNPSILIHEPSYNLNNTFFKNLINYRSSKKISNVLNVINNQEIKSYLEKLNSNESIDEHINSLKSINNINKYQQILLAFGNII